MASMTVSASVRPWNNLLSSTDSSPSNGTMSSLDTATLLFISISHVFQFCLNASLTVREASNIGFLSSMRSSSSLAMPSLDLCSITSSSCPSESRHPPSSAASATAARTPRPRRSRILMVADVTIPPVAKHRPSAKSPQSRPRRGPIATSLSRNQVAGSLRPAGVLEAKPSVEQTPRHHAPALEHEIGVGAQEPRPDRRHPARRRQSDAHARGGALLRAIDGGFRGGTLAEALRGLIAGHDHDEAPGLQR